jgi:hypothetical protein
MKIESWNLKTSIEIRNLKHEDFNLYMKIESWHVKTSVEIWNLKIEDFNLYMKIESWHLKTSIERTGVGLVAKSALFEKR